MGNRITGMVDASIDQSEKNHTEREEFASVIPGKKGADQERTQR